VSAGKARRLELIFDDIARRVSEGAAEVECSPAEYRAGLRQIISQLQSDLGDSAEADPAGAEEDEPEPQP
jgi:hypothetical protein